MDRGGRVHTHFPLKSLMNSDYTEQCRTAPDEGETDTPSAIYTKASIQKRGDIRSARVDIRPSRREEAR
jgi:hypothetical protein